MCTVTPKLRWWTVPATWLCLRATRLLPYDMAMRAIDGILAFMLQYGVHAGTGKCPTL